jgi:hypothetical protein
MLKKPGIWLYSRYWQAICNQDRPLKEAILSTNYANIHKPLGERKSYRNILSELVREDFFQHGVFLFKQTTRFKSKHKLVWGNRQRGTQASSNITGFRESRWKTAQRILIGDYFLCYLTGVSRLIGLLGQI